jgi:hypothetical protein
MAEQPYGGSMWGLFAVAAARYEETWDERGDYEVDLAEYLDRVAPVGCPWCGIDVPILRPSMG